MRKIMKCEGFELIWNTLSLSKLEDITRSRFTLRIDCISNMPNLHFLPTGKNIVHKSSICPPTWLPFLKLCIQSSLQVFPCMVNGLIQFTWQSGLFTGNPPSSSSSSPVNSTISVRSFTFPAPGQTSMPNFPHAAFTHSNKIFSKKNVDTSEWSFLSLSPKTIFPPVAWNVGPNSSYTTFATAWAFTFSNSRRYSGFIKGPDLFFRFRT